jgi:ABC-2 type transport system permease protein
MRLSFVPVYRRELRAYFQNPGVYVTLAVFLGLTGLLIYVTIQDFARICMNPQMRYRYGLSSLNYTEYVIANTFGMIGFLFLFVIPLLTMRLFAEEKRSGTFELLATCPITDWGLVLGKYLAALSVIIAFLIVSVVFPITFSRIGQTEWPIVASGYLALMLLGVAYAAFGAFASTLTENQIIAAVVTFFGLLAFWLADIFGIGSMGLLSRILNAVSIREHMENLIRGRILTEDIAYFILFSAGFLFLANHVLESRRWRV